MNHPLGKSVFTIPSTIIDDLAIASHPLEYQMCISELIYVEILRDPNCNVDMETLRTNIQEELAKLVLNTKPRSLAVLLSALCFGGHHMSTAYLGHECLKMLERQLRPTSLSPCNQDHLQALFLLLFGTLISVGLAEPIFDLPPFPEVNPNTQFLLISSTNRLNSRTIRSLLEYHELCTMY
jgi:hypothetical protein